MGPLLRKFWYEYTNGFFASGLIVVMWVVAVGIGVAAGMAAEGAWVLLVSTCLPLLVLGFAFDVLQWCVDIKSPVRRSIVVWAALFPAFKVMGDVITFLLVDPGMAFTEYFTYYSNVDNIATSLLMWGAVGCAFGVGFALAYSRVVEFRLSRRSKAEKRRAEEILRERIAKSKQAKGQSGPEAK